MRPTATIGRPRPSHLRVLQTRASLGGPGCLRQCNVRFGAHNGLRSVVTRGQNGAKGGNESSFDDLVGEREQRCRNSDTERLGSLKVDCGFELCRLKDRQVSRFFSLRIRPE